jgi:isoamylase
MNIWRTSVSALHPGSGVMHPGTYRGLMERIPYFTDLGVTAVEFMPVQEFNEHQVIGINPRVICSEQ